MLHGKNPDIYSQIINHAYVILASLDPCVRLNCSKYFGSCVLSIHSAPECKCLHDCGYQDRPVCGEDKNTYFSECALMRDTCIREIPNNVKHHGQCSKWTLFYTQRTLAIKKYNSLSHSKELLKLYIELYYRFVISCLVLEIFGPKLMSCPPSWTNSLPH